MSKKQETVKESCVITLKGTQGKITGLSDVAKRELAAAFTFTIKNSWFMKKHHPNWDGSHHFFNRLTSAFDVGLLPLIVERLQEMEVEDVKIQDNRMSVFSLPTDRVYDTLSGKILREYQRQAVDSVLNNTIRDIPFPCGVINIATNGGKTVIAAVIIRNLLPYIDEEDKILFLTHSKEIAFQTQKVLAEDLGQKIGFIGDGKWDDEPQVIVAIIATLNSKSKADDLNGLKEVTKGYIADEAHHSQANTWYDIMKSLENAYVRVGLTGTIPKDDEVKEHRLYGVTGGITCRITNKFLIDNGFSSVPVCKFITVEKPVIKATEFHEVYETGIVENTYRNELIVRTIIDERRQGSNILVLVERLTHGEAIIESLAEWANHSDELCDILGFFDFTNGGKDGNYRKNILESLKDGSVSTLIATSVLDEGVDVENINAVIYARGKKSPTKLLQGIGRGLRKKADGSTLKFYDFLDLGHPHLAKHSQERFKNIRSEGFKVEKYMPPDI